MDSSLRNTKNALSAVLLLAAAVSCASEEAPGAGPLFLRTAADGSLSFDGGGIAVDAFFPGWATAQVEEDAAAAEDDAAHVRGPDAGRPFAVIRRKDGAVAFKGRAVWKERDDGTVSGDVRIEALAPATMQCLALSVGYPAEPPSGLGSFDARQIDVPLGGGRSLRLAFDKPQRCFAQDSRPWGGGWTTRFGDLRMTQDFAAGEVAEWHVVLSDPSGAPVRLSEETPVEILSGDHWIPLVWHKDVEPGSALDFSGMGFQDAPAGKHGWLRAAGGQFEFEGVPGVAQRFYGVNLCFSANYPDHALADVLVERFVRCGYNAVRIHHHDKAWAGAHASRKVEKLKSRKAECRTDDRGQTASMDIQTLNPSTFQPFNHAVDFIGDEIDRLDYLLAKCFERGIYATTDLYVSRKVPWRDIGVDRDGDVDGQLYKTLVGIYDPAFEDWCRWAEAFLLHVNPYTGRAYLDEPGMPLISLVNEGKLGMGYAAKAADPRVLAAWNVFNAETQRRGETESVAHGEGTIGKFGGNSNGIIKDSSAPLRLCVEENIPIPSGSGAPHFDEFEEWVNRRTFERCAAFVRSLGCRALLTNDNNGARHGEGQGATPLYDYVDSHFYVDHPGFLKEPWKLPSRCVNLNPVKSGSPALLHRGYAKDASKPYVISEWNFSGPGRFRGVGGILTGALAAQDGWDGLWRFAYSHSSGNLVDGKGNMGYFDCVTDPLVSASDRAAVFLFLSGGAVQEEERGVERLKVEKLKSSCSAPATKDSGIFLDRERGSMALVTPLLCGGFAESGRIDAGALSFEIVAPGQGPAHKTTINAGIVPAEAQNSTKNLSTFQPFNLSTERGGHAVPATLWASSLDGAPLAESSRILLVHLADVQGKHARYADETRQVLMKWGVGTLIEASAAEVELRLNCPQTLNATNVHKSSMSTNANENLDLGLVDNCEQLEFVNNPFAVFALDTAGRGVAEIPSAFDPASGTLRFRADTRGPDGSGCIFYEIVK